ncbi:hypothetical protein C4577_02680 [Candidatus Parcubacteria bacterium]|nr:MAG: hypothetical protein C4577_02680 [Candidatus Parcubacteria bacterium]
MNVLVRWKKRFQRLAWFVIRKGAFAPMEFWIGTRPFHVLLFALFVVAIFMVLDEKWQRGAWGITVLALVLGLANLKDRLAR